MASNKLEWMPREDFDQLLMESMAVSLEAESTIKHLEMMQEIQARYDWGMER